MKTEVHRRPFGTMESPRFVVMLSCMNGAILLGPPRGAGYLGDAGRTHRAG